LVSALAVLALGAAAPSASADHPGTPSPLAGEGWFHFTCTVVPGKEALRIDPLVFPGTTTVSHPHQFVGNKSINENSTNASLRANPATTCQDDGEENPGPGLPSVPEANRKYGNALWYPTFYENGVQLTANRVTTGYSVGNGVTRDFAAIQPFVDDLNFIAGSSAGGPQQVNNQFVYKLLCPSGVAVPGSQTSSGAPLCNQAGIRVQIFAPDCWDGVNATAANHKTHLAYSRRLTGATLNTCPPTHPVLIPAHRITIELASRGGSALTVATGSGTNAVTTGPMSTLHYDYMSAVVREVDGSNTRSARTHNCLNKNEYCGGTALPVPGEGGGI
jgi:hypothetical protein